MRQKITTRVVDALKPGQCVFDSELRNFAVRCQKSAEIKTFILKTIVQGRQKLVTIGQYGNPWTVTTARQYCQKLIGEKVAGSDIGRRKTEKKTVSEAADEFLVRYVEPRLAKRTRREYSDHIKLFIKPKLGGLQIRSLDYGDIEELHASLSDRPVRANRVRSTLSKLCNWCELKGYRAKGTNPVAGLMPYDEEARERFLSDDEVRSVGKVLASLLASSSVSPYALAAIQLLLLTGCRTSEVQTLKWSYVDLSSQVLRLPRRKSGEFKTIYLNEQAVTVLAELPRVLNNPYVIVGTIEGQHFKNLTQLWARIRQEAGLAITEGPAGQQQRVRIHDLRHSFASFAASEGASLLMIGRLLGHTNPRTTARYAHLFPEEIQAANQSVGVRLALAIGKN